MTDYLKQDSIIRGWFVVNDLGTKIKAVSDFIKDKTIPFEVRLALARDTPSHLQTIKSWVMHPDDFEKKWQREVTWSDGGLYFSRHEIITVDSVDDDAGIFEDFEDDLLEEGMDEAAAAAKRAEFRQDFLEEFLLKGIHGFKLDW
jgi:hypothetical protein